MKPARRCPCLASGPWGVLLALSLLLLAPFGARADVRAFGLVIGTNLSNDPGVKPLRYADDDAVNNGRLLAELGAEVVLLASFDQETRQLFPGVPETPPTRSAVDQAMMRINQRMADESARGHRTVLYVFYSGHGDVEKSGLEAGPDETRGPEGDPEPEHPSACAGDPAGEPECAPTSCASYASQTTCEAADCTWVECLPNADCAFYCVDKVSEPTSCLELGNDREACEAAGCDYAECPPNADCAYFCREHEEGESGEPDGGVEPVPNPCNGHTSQGSCEAAECSFRQCPPEEGGGYHCVDMRCAYVDNGQSGCEAAGCVWADCPPNADCAYLCKDPAWDLCDSLRCEQLGGEACEARADCQVVYQGFCDCDFTEHEPGGGCAGCGAGCFVAMCTPAP